MGDMLTINTAKSPWALLYFFIFSLLQGKEEPLAFVWRFYKSIVKQVMRTWNNSISTKNKKEERTITRNPYLISLVVIL